MAGTRHGRGAHLAHIYSHALLPAICRDGLGLRLTNNTWRRGAQPVPDFHLQLWSEQVSEAWWLIRGFLRGGSI